MLTPLREQVFFSFDVKKMFSVSSLWATGLIQWWPPEGPSVLCQGTIESLKVYLLAVQDQYLEYS